MVMKMNKRSRSALILALITLALFIISVTKEDLFMTIWNLVFFSLNALVFITSGDEK